MQDPTSPNISPDDERPAPEVPKPSEVSATARKAARRNHKGATKRGKNNRGPRADETRLEMVMRLMDSFEQPPYIQRVVAKAYKVTERTVREDIVRINAERALEAEPDAYQEKLAFKRLLATQVRECLRDGNKSEARRFMDMLIKIGGHYAPDAVRMMEFDIGDLRSLSDDDLNRLAEEMYRQYGPPTALRGPQAKRIEAPPGAAAGAAPIEAAATEVAMPVPTAGEKG